MAATRLSQARFVLLIVTIIVYFDYVYSALVVVFTAYCALQIVRLTLHYITCTRICGGMILE